MDRRLETASVKRALVKAGLPIKRVKHGTGTACGWLKIYLNDENLDREAWWARYRQAVSIAQQVTGRHGEYDGRINVH